MKLLFLGDSITEGVGASSQDKRYTDLVGARLVCRTVNYGISGTRIARQQHTSFKTTWDIDFRTRVPLMEMDADAVFVFGGTNDYGHGTLHLGTPYDNDEATFCTQLRLLISELIEKYGKDKICFILPARRFDEDPVFCKGENAKEKGATLLEYVESMRQILTEYSIDYIDLFKNGFPKPETNCGDEYTADGVHPNDKGYSLIADRVTEYVKEKLAIR